MTEGLFDNYQRPDLIINYGTAGSINSNLKIGDWVIPCQIEKYDYGQAIHPAIIIDSLYINVCQEKLKELGVEPKIGTNVSVSKVVTSKKQKDKLLGKWIINTMDMESYAIGYESNKNCTPFLAIKMISDLADENTKNDYYKSLERFSDKLGKIIKGFLKIL